MLKNLREKGELDEYLRNLDADVEQQLETVERQLLEKHPVPENAGSKEKAAHLGMIHNMARELVLPELVYDPPAAEDEDESEMLTPGQAEEWAFRNMPWGQQKK